jgi:hypothetical protein
MKIGSTNIINAKIGSTNIQKVFSGSDLVWSAVDPDAQAFITAAAITNPTQQSAVNQLVVDLKGYGVWTTMKALYPFVGGTASQHKFNLKDPRDLDAAFRIVFNGGWTHSTTGATPNGINAYADTKLIPLSSLSDGNSKHSSLYSRTASTASFVKASGIYQGVFTSWVMTLRRSVGVPFDGFVGTNTNDNNFVNFLATDSKGFYLSNRTSSTNYKGSKNGSILSVNTSAGTNQLPSVSYYISAVNGAGFYDDKEISFASIGDGLTDTEAANYYTAVQTFQTALNRQV